jgi:hypothetical protein
MLVLNLLLPVKTPKVKLLERLFRSVKSNINATQRRDAQMQLTRQRKFIKVASLARINTRKSNDSVQGM